MSSDRWQEIERIYTAALDPLKRDAVLSELDVELRREVEALLADRERNETKLHETDLQGTETLVGPGTLLGPYRIETPLGAGGMGQVFRGVDTRLGRIVAVKISHARFGDRFRREALAISSLNHPNICTLYDIGPNYLVMELVEGETLAARLKQGKLSLEETRQFGAQISDALSTAHAKGITHRDLKPGNIMVTKFGIKVLDFGLAKLQTSADEGLTATNVVMGTPAYMAPEQFVGRDADARSDIFALGLILHEMATGDRLSQGQSPSPKAVPAQLAPVIERCLATDPNERWQSANELKEALERLEKPLPVHARHAIVKWSLAAALVAALLIVAFATWRQHQQPKVRSIAVLPLRGISSDSSQQYIADGLAEQLITDLSKIAGFRVVSFPSVMRYASNQTDLPGIAKELGVGLILTGSILKVDQRVRISVQLVEMPGDKNVWAESYDRDLKDVLALQSQVATAVASSVSVSLTPRERSGLENARSSDSQANEFYLQGRFFANKVTDSGLRKGINYFRRAIDQDPNFASAYSGLAFAYSSLANFYVAPAEAMPQAKEAASKAIQLDASLSEPHALLGMVHLYYDWDWEKAESELKQAVALNASSALAHLLYQDMLLATGRIAEALVEGEKSIESDPLSVRVLSEAQFANLIAGRNEKAIELGMKISEIEPQSGLGHVYTGLAYSQINELKQAIQELETAVRLEPTVLAKGFLAHVRALNGDRAGAQKLLEELKKENAKRYVCSFEIALGYATLGDTDEAFRMLNQGLKNRADCMVWLKSEPWLKSIRQDPRFEPLTTQVGLK